MHRSWVPTCPAGHPCEGRYSGAQRQLCPPGVNRQGTRGKAWASRKAPRLPPQPSAQRLTAESPRNKKQASVDLEWGMEYTELATDPTRLMQEASRPPLPQSCPHLLTSLGVLRQPQHPDHPPAPSGAALVAPPSQGSLGVAPAYSQGSRSGPTSSLS